MTARATGPSCSATRDFPPVCITEFDAHETGGVAERWPENEDLADRVLLEPPTDVASAAARLEETEGYECADWWYCHRGL